MGSETKTAGKRLSASPEVAPETAGIRKGIETLLNTSYGTRRIGDAQWGVYAFFDYDGEPIYVGQTEERLRTRIRRHLTNQRTDAVAMGVLDPFEVLEVELWPLDLSRCSAAERKETLARAEYTVYRNVLRTSKLKAVLNEKAIPRKRLIKLPASVRRRIVPEDVYEIRKHPDIRIARRAAAIAALAKVISERKVSPGLRITLVTQARRLQWLAESRARELHVTRPVEAPGEETGEEA